MSDAVDAVVVGAGPNGLAAAITLARAGRSVLVLEGAATAGGGSRSAELTAPGFVHDVCSTTHPLAAVSPFFAGAAGDLERHGLELVHPEVALAHPLDGGRAGIVHRSAADTAAGLGVDGRAWERHVGWVARRWPALTPAVLGPILRPAAHPLTLAGFGLRSLPPAVTFARRAFHTDEAAALLGGAAAHAFLPLTRPLTTSFGLVLLGSAHAAGWPAAKGGSQAIIDAMASLLVELGGRIEVNRPVATLADLPPARAVLFDVTPRQLVSICGDELPARYRWMLGRYRYGPGVFKIDYALTAPVPWANPDCRRAGTLHVGGPLQEIVTAEADVAAGRHAERPFLLVAQHSIHDPTRAPAGQHTLWVYCHVPHGSDVDRTEAVERQLERFAPGFRDVVLHRHTSTSRWYEGYNPNFIGGDIAGGSGAGLQLFLRPGPFVRPYRTPNPKLFICSASTPPGGGVHGMCGAHAADAALRTTLR